MTPFRPISRLTSKELTPDKTRECLNLYSRTTFGGIQLDGATGRLLHIERRNADLIENIHDGLILDYRFGIKSEYLKLVYTSVMGTALMIFTITGFWLWYGPKRMRNRNR